MRYITCVVARNSKTVKVYNADSHLEAMALIKKDNRMPFKIKYIKDMDNEYNMEEGKNNQCIRRKL